MTRPAFGRTTAFGHSLSASLRRRPSLPLTKACDTCSEVLALDCFARGDGMLGREDDCTNCSGGSNVAGMRERRYAGGAPVEQAQSAPPPGIKHPVDPQLAASETEVQDCDLWDSIPDEPVSIDDQVRAANEEWDPDVHIFPMGDERPTAPPETAPPRKIQQPYRPQHRLPPSCSASLTSSGCS